MIGYPSRHTLHQARGFTLIEVVVTLALFSMTVLLAVTLLVVYIQQQRRTINQEQLQNDSRAVMEKISQDVREGTIDYTYYITSYVGEKQKLFASQDGAVTPLVLRDPFNVQVMYRVQSNLLQRCTPAIENSCAAAEWQSISPTAMQVTGMSFYITPSEDAFQQQAYIACGTSDPAVFNENLCRWGTSCQGFTDTGAASGMCALLGLSGATTSCYCVPRSFGSIIPLQPRVTFSLTALRTSGGKSVSETFQTTVSSRVFRNADALNHYVP